MRNFSRLVLVFGVLLLIVAGILRGTGHGNMAGLALIVGLIALALVFRSFSSLKGFAYTVWILVAVAAAMCYPGAFHSIGDFELKRVIVPFVQLTMFGMGAHMTFNDFKGVVKMPKGVIIGVCCHFLVMPLVAYGLSHLFDFPAEIAGGVILIGCVSSAMASNVMSYLAGANLALAVTTGAVSTMVSPLITPFLMQWLGGQYVQIDVAHMMIDITNMIIIPVMAGFIFNLHYYRDTPKKQAALQMIVFAAVILLTNAVLASLTGGTVAGFSRSTALSFAWFYMLPWVAGTLFRRYRESVTRKQLDGWLSFAAMLGIVINTVVITASGRDNLLAVGGLLIVTCFLHNVAGLGLGYFLAKLFGLPEKDRRTIAFEVGMQNGGVATGLALQMGKVATVGLASAIFGPLQNVTGSALANWFRNRDKAAAAKRDTMEQVGEPSEKSASN